MQFFDSLGYSYTAKFVFRQSDSRNDYSLELDKIVDSTGKEVAVGEEAKALLGTAVSFLIPPVSGSTCHPMTL